MATSRTIKNGVDKYISGFPKETQRILGQIRATIKKAAPKSEEVISYRMPAYKYHGMLMYFAAFKNHIGFYPPPPKAFRKEVSPYEGPKGNLKFPIDKPIPLDLVKRIVKFRIKENLERAETKEKKKK